MTKTKKLKLLIISDYFYPHWTGISKAMLYLVQSIDHVYDITVLTTQFDKKLTQKQLFNKTTVIRCPAIFKISRTHISFNLILKFISLIQTQDVVFINSPCTYILILSLLTRFARKKLLVFHQGDLILPKGIKNKVIEKIFDISSLIGCLFAQKVSTYTEDYAKHSRILSRFLYKFTPLLVPVTNLDVSQKTIPQLTTLRKKHTILLGFAGRFVEEKGFDLLFKAIPKVIKTLPNVHFVFAGETKMGYENFFDTQKLAYDKIKRHVSFLGLLDAKKMNYFFSHINLILLPSRSDCFPLVQVEAMLRHVPAVCADIPGARVAVQKTRFGLLHKKEDFHDLSEKIILAVEQLDYFAKYQSQVSRFFSYETITQSITDYITN